MFSLLRNRFGIPGVISVIALVFAMFGGAYAASNDGGGKATASAKAKKGPRGPKGPKGDTGPAGPAGPAGPQGANGKDGANGTNGAPGKDGEDGVSATGTSFGPTEEPLSEPCEEKGGVEFESAGPDTYACNGEAGSPWVAGGVLPSEATETGAWAAIGGQYAPIPFAIPLAVELPEANVHIVPAAGPVPPACDNGALPAASAADPEADPGHLCAFVTSGEEAFAGIFKDGTLAEGEPVLGAGKTGAVILNFGGGIGTHGSFAVTAP